MTMDIFLYFYILCPKKKADLDISLSSVTLCPRISLVLDIYMISSFLCPGKQGFPGHKTSYPADMSKNEGFLGHRLRILTYLSNRSRQIGHSPLDIKKMSDPTAFI